MNIKVTSDSTSDLTDEIRQKYGISVVPTTVIYKDKEYLDGVNINSNLLFEWTAKDKELPRTSASNPSEYKEFFEKIFATEKPDAIIHFSLSSKMSSMFQNARIASQNFDEGKVVVIDSQTLSTGIGIQMLYACDLAKQGLSAKQIENKILERRPYAQASFFLDTLKYMHRGGRCSTIALLGANLLKIKPVIEVVDGSMGVSAKPRGKYEDVAQKYLEHTLTKYNHPDRTRCFITYSSLDEKFEKTVLEDLKKQLKPIFKEILITQAGTTVSTHCGPNTLGVLYYNDGPEFELKK